MIKREDIELIERVSIKAQRALNSILRVKKLEEDLDKLTRKEIQTIFTIGSKGNRTMGDIASCLGVAISTPVTTIDRLIKKEYVLRRVGEEDRRQVLVSLTEKGNDLYDKLLEIRLSNMELILNSFSEEEMHMFRVILRKLDREL